MTMKLDELRTQLEATLNSDVPDALSAVELLFEYVKRQAKFNSLIRKYDRICVDIDFAQLKGDITLAAGLCNARDNLLVQIRE